MEKIVFGTTGLETTRLGFGGSRLLGSLSQRQSVALLKTAYDLGIRHFDTSPMYGEGEAESCLGALLKSCRADVTLTTKYGIGPKRSKGFKRQVIGLAKRSVRPLMQTLPMLKRKLSEAARSLEPSAQKAAFTPAEARLSLEHSLRNLQTDHLDLWLLHEATASDLSNPALLDTMHQAVSGGLVKAFGVGSSADKIDALYTERRTYCSFMQFEWSLCREQKFYDDAFCIHHGVLNNGLTQLETMMSRKPGLRQNLSDQVGFDLSNRRVLASLMLKAALELNPQSIILFFSAQPKNIEANVAAAENKQLGESARLLYTLIRSQRIV